MTFGILSMPALTDDRNSDPRSKFLVSNPSYMLLTFIKRPPTMTVEIKGLGGSVLDRKDFGGK